LRCVNVKEIKYPKYSKPLYANMLRSEHIAFNLFVPFKADRRFGKNVLNLFLNNQIKSIDKILIEYAPNPSEEYLNDKTSFDAYIEYTHIDEEKGIVGIEVKYTEHEYKLKKGSKEETDLNNRESTYFKITEKSGLYLPGITQKLISDKFRQIWRNQLLGESIILKDKSVFKHFTSLMIFPRGNTHFIEASQEYLAMLSDNENRFVPLTYEAFISNCERFCPNEEFKKWISYCCTQSKQFK